MNSQTLPDTRWHWHLRYDNSDADGSHDSSGSSADEHIKALPCLDGVRDEPPLIQIEHLFKSQLNLSKSKEMIMEHAEAGVKVCTYDFRSKVQAHPIPSYPPIASLISKDFMKLEHIKNESSSLDKVRVFLICVISLQNTLCYFINILQFDFIFV